MVMVAERSTGKKVTVSLKVNNPNDQKWYEFKLI